MSRTNDLSPPIDNTIELLTIGFDFGLVLGQDEIIGSIASIACATYSGIDANPNSRLIGLPQIVNSQKTQAPLSAVAQQVGGMLAGVTYRLQCVVRTSLGNFPSLWTQFACVGTNVPSSFPPPVPPLPPVPPTTSDAIVWAIIFG